LPAILYGCKIWSLTIREEQTQKAFQNRVLRRILATRRDETIDGWRKLHNEELHNLYSSTYIMTIIKSKRMRWAGHAAYIWRSGMHRGFLWESRKERDHQEDLYVGGKIILKYVLEKCDGMLWIGLIQLRIGARGGLL
jgi:hypothetical protein